MKNPESNRKRLVAYHWIYRCKKIYRIIVAIKYVKIWVRLCKNNLKTQIFLSLSYDSRGVL